MLAEALKRQFAAAFDVLEAAIPSFTPHQWLQGKPPFDGPARAAAHVLQCADFYACEELSVFANLGKKVWVLTDGELPSQQRMLDYLRTVREQTRRWIDSLGQAGFDKPWHNDKAINSLERVAYALRHLQHHIGEICAYQKQANLPPAEWK